MADASPVAPSSDTPIVASTGAAEAPVSPVGDDPSRVKTISVRPDGTLISSGYEAADAAPQPAPAPTASAAPGVGRPGADRVGRPGADSVGRPGACACARRHRDASVADRRAGAGAESP